MHVEEMRCREPAAKLPPARFVARFLLALNLVASGCFGAKDRLGKRFFISVTTRIIV
jgi:hypothetical protein